MITLKKGLSCRCPKCETEKLYNPSIFDLNLKEQCKNCGLNLGHNDSADGPAVFLIFVLGFLLVPSALFFDALFSPPLWTHAILWGSIALGICIGTLKPLKSYIIYLQYKYRKSDWD